MKRKTKNLMLWTVGLLFLAGVVALVVVSGSGATDRASYSAGALSTAGERFDFGTVAMDAGDVKHEFEVKNDSAEPVRIEKVYTSCMCTTAFITAASGKKYGGFGMPGHGLSPRTNVEIGPGASAIIEVVFDPAAHGPSGVGLAQRSIYLETNSARSPKIELSFQAIVVR